MTQTGRTRGLRHRKAIKAFLEREGFCVVKSVLSRPECEEALDLLWRELEAGMFLTYGYGCLPVRVRVSPYGYPYPYELLALGVFTAANSWGFQRHVFLLGLQGVRSRYP